MHELHKLPKGLAERDRKNNNYYHFHTRTQLEGEIIMMLFLCIAFLALGALRKEFTVSLEATLKVKLEIKLGRGFLLI